MIAFSEPFSVRWSELGSDDHLQISALLGYMDHTAGRHARALGVSVSDLADCGLTWVLARMKLDIRRLPGGEEPLMVETWAAGMHRRLFRRDYRITTETGAGIAAAATFWVPLSLITRKPEDIPFHLIDRIPVSSDVAVGNADVRLPVLNNGLNGPLFKIRQADIDRNGHVNNGRYVDFLLETASLAGYGDRRPAGVEITFRSESHYGDAVAAIYAPETETAVRISLTRKSDNRELVRARLTFA